MLSPLQQAVDRLQKSQNILIALPENLNGDSLGSALALAEILNQLTKKVDVVAAEPVPEKLSFLYGANQLKRHLQPRRDFIISVNTEKNKIASLRYEQQNNSLKIFLATPRQIEEKDIKLEAGAFAYELIVVLDAPDLETLGRTFEDHTELFFQKPILNIDHQAANENFGEINLVEPAAAANAEIIVKLLESFGMATLSPSQATSLLCGLVTKTHSFQNIRTTPQSLNLASWLISQGADRELIIQQLYKTKPLNRLKLFGRLLEQTEYDATQKILWAKAGPADLAATASSSRDLTCLLEEISDFFPEARIIFILWTDKTGAIWALGQGERTEIIQKISLELGGTVKQNRWLAKTAFSSPEQAKEAISRLLNSLP